MTGKYPHTANAPRPNTAPRPAAPQPNRPARPGVNPAPRQASAAKPTASAKSAPKAPAKAGKKRGWPIIELVLFLLVIKIAAGAYYILSAPKEAQAQTGGSRRDARACGYCRSCCRLSC